MKTLVATCLLVIRDGPLALCYALRQSRTFDVVQAYLPSMFVRVCHVHDAKKRHGSKYT